MRGITEEGVWKGRKAPTYIFGTFIKLTLKRVVVCSARIFYLMKPRKTMLIAGRQLNEQLMEEYEEK